MSKLLWRLVILVLFLPILGSSQYPRSQNATALYNDLQKLNFLGSALYIAAHPDDENTRLISYLSNKVHAKTAYLSLTRGDGGQNLIGTELRELLGVLRTQELLAARRVDGGQQFFTRAVDFGYSKHPDETLKIWDKDLILSDVVRIIRQFQPDIIINRFDHRTPGSTHGHHTSSALLSVAAFDLVGNTQAYPDQLTDLDAWQPKRLFHNTSWWSYGSRERFLEAVNITGHTSLDVGVFYPEKGLSNNEIAALASSQHRCQGFGRPMARGSEFEYLELIEGSALNSDNLFEGIDTSWNRIPGGSAVGSILEKIESEYNFANPAVHLPELLAAHKLLAQLEDSHWKRAKLPQLTELIAGVAGLYLEISSTNALAVPGATQLLNLELINRSSRPIRVRGIALYPNLQIDTVIPLNENIANRIKIELNIPTNQESTTPYWLRTPGSLGTYAIPSNSLIGKPETPNAFFADLDIEINDERLTIRRPVIHRYSEPDKGELYRNFDIVPPVSVATTETVKIFANNHGQLVSVRVKANANNVNGSLSLKVPTGWMYSPEEIPVAFELTGEEQVFQFSLIPPETNSQGNIYPNFVIDKSIYDQELVTISYDHIPTQLVLVPALTRVVRMQVEKAGQHIGYLMGAGDAIPENLEAIGYTVNRLQISDLTPEKLASLDAVVLGIRAYNVLDDLKFKNELLVNYVQEGGTLIVQYNTTGRGNQDFSAMAPYPIRLSRDRVSEEDAQVSILEPTHPVLNFPNTIGTADFEGWVQERGLYFPDQWDNAYVPLLGMHDTGEPERKGSILVAPFGKGNYIYTGLSFFRELPAGVPGAFKLFANMLSIGKAKSSKGREIKG